jgi:hypothetical protein
MPPPNVLVMAATLAYTSLRSTRRTLGELDVGVQCCQGVIWELEGPIGRHDFVDLPLVSVLYDSQCDLCRGEACRCICGPVDSMCRSMLSDVERS